MVVFYPSKSNHLLRMVEPQFFLAVRRSFFCQPNLTRWFDPRRVLLWWEKNTSAVLGNDLGKLKRPYKNIYRCLVISNDADCNPKSLNSEFWFWDGKFAPKWSFCIGSMGLLECSINIQSPTDLDKTWFQSSQVPKHSTLTWTWTDRRAEIEHVGKSHGTKRVYAWFGGALRFAVNQKTWF